MKKKYEKPRFLFESFSMNTNIAGDCETDITNLSKNTCAWEVPASGPLVTLYIFTNDVDACTTKPADGMYNNVCYDVPTSGLNLFNS